MTLPVISTVKTFSEKHPAFSEGGLRWKIFHADENGLATSGALVRDGRRVLINEEKFFAWLLARQQERTGRKPGNPQK